MMCFPVSPYEVERVMEDARGQTCGITPKQCHLLDKCGALQWGRIDPAQNQTLSQKEVKAMIDKSVAFYNNIALEQWGTDGPAWSSGVETLTRVCSHLGCPFPWDIRLRQCSGKAMLAAWIRTVGYGGCRLYPASQLVLRHAHSVRQVLKLTTENSNEYLRQVEEKTELRQQKQEAAAAATAASAAAADGDKCKLNKVDPGCGGNESSDFDSTDDSEEEGEEGARCCALVDSQPSTPHARAHPCSAGGAGPRAPCKRTLPGADLTPERVHGSKRRQAWVFSVGGEEIKVVVEQGAGVDPKRRQAVERAIARSVAQGLGTLGGVRGQGPLHHTL